MDEEEGNRPTAAQRAARKSLVKDVWIGAGLLMLAVGETAGIAVIALACTCLSFMILDEMA